MQEERFTEPIELNIAANPAMMLIIRLTTAGVVTRAGLTIDAMESLKIAAEEACACLISQAQPPKRLHVTYSCEGDALVISVDASDIPDEPGNLDEAELEVVRCILEALADQVDIVVSNGWIRAIALRAALA